MFPLSPHSLPPPDGHWSQKTYICSCMGDDLQHFLVICINLLMQARTYNDSPKVEIFSDFTFRGENKIIPSKKDPGYFNLPKGLQVASAGYGLCKCLFIRKWKKTQWFNFFHRWLKICQLTAGLLTLFMYTLYLLSFIFYFYLLVS